VEPTSVFELSAGLVVLWLTLHLIRTVFDFLGKRNVTIENTNDGLLTLVQSLLSDFRAILDRLVTTQQDIANVISRISETQKTLIENTIQDAKRHAEIISRLDAVSGLLDTLISKTNENACSAPNVNSGGAIDEKTALDN
jgi:hypothetical protein